MRNIIIELSDEDMNNIAVNEVPILVNDAIIEGRPLVRCKDCKYWMREPRYCLRLDEHPYRAKHWDADDFCSRGVKDE